MTKDIHGQEKKLDCDQEDKLEKDNCGYLYNTLSLNESLHVAVYSSATNIPGLLKQEYIPTARNFDCVLNKRCNEGSVTEPKDDFQRKS